MRVYLAGEMDIGRTVSDEALITANMKFRLMSYAYHGRKTGLLTKDVLRTQSHGIPIFLDSGAFTAHQQGTEIDIEEYAKFCVKYDDVFHVKANLDVIGDGDGSASWANLKTLESLGAKVFPVYHFGDDEKYLVKILDEGYEFFALGGLVGASRKRLQEWLDRIWSDYLVTHTGHARAKVHGFGLTDQVLMLRYPWFSVDSASWIFSANFGSGMFVKDGKLIKIDFSDDSPTIEGMKAWHYARLNPDEQREVDKWFEGSGVDAQRCATDYFARFVVNARAYTELGKYNTDTFLLEQPGFF